MNRELYPIVDEDELLTIGWPNRENIRGRAILAVASYLGALDFADGQPIDKNNVKKREYHHIFPDALLEEAYIDSSKALNCALITWKTNRIIGREDPLEYIKKRSDWIEENIVEKRLHSHLIPLAELSLGSYNSDNEEQRLEKIKKDYNRFLRKRARLMSLAANKLSQGKDIDVEGILNEDK